MSIKKECPRCSGDGEEPGVSTDFGEKALCSRCGGKGEVAKRRTTSKVKDLPLRLCIGNTYMRMDFKELRAQRILIGKYLGRAENTWAEQGKLEGIREFLTQFMDAAEEVLGHDAAFGKEKS